MKQLVRLQEVPAGFHESAVLVCHQLDERTLQIRELDADGERQWLLRTASDSTKNMAVICTVELAVGLLAPCWMKVGRFTPVAGQPSITSPVAFVAYSVADQGDHISLELRFYASLNSVKDKGNMRVVLPKSYSFSYIKEMAILDEGSLCRQSLTIDLTCVAADHSQSLIRCSGEYVFGQCRRTAVEGECDSVFVPNHCQTSYSVDLVNNLVGLVMSRDHCTEASG